MSPFLIGKGGLFGSGLPLRKALSISKDLSGWDNGVEWPAPLTVAKVRMFPYTWVHPATYSIKHQNKLLLNIKHKKER